MSEQKRKDQVWLCTDCATELFAFPFKNWQTLGQGKRRCAKCGVVRKQSDRMHWCNATEEFFQAAGISTQAPAELTEIPS